VIALAKHIPFHKTMAGNRVLVSHEGQPMTCYGCNEVGHLYQVCLNRRRVGGTAPFNSWADIAAKGTRSQSFDKKEGEEEAQNGDQASQAKRTRSNCRSQTYKTTMESPSRNRMNRKE
jgi:hypothetical protein